MGIVTDSYAIFVEIDLDSFERNINELKGRADFHEHKTLPLRYKVLDCLSASPTLREALMYFFYTAFVDYETEKIRQERMLKLREYLWLLRNRMRSKPRSWSTTLKDQMARPVVDRVQLVHNHRQHWCLVMKQMNSWKKKIFSNSHPMIMCV